MIQLLHKYEIAVISLGDAWNLCDLMVANENRFRRYFPKTLEQNLTPTLSKAFTEKKVAEFKKREEFLFTIKKKKSNAIVGLVYIKKLDWQKNQGEFAYCIGYQYQNQGIISSAVKALSAYAFNELGLEILQIIVHKDNIASVKVAENSGFSWQKTLLKEYTSPNEDLLDMELYELARPVRFPKPDRP